MSPAGSRLAIRRTVAEDDPGIAADLLAALSGLSKSAVKDAMNKGAVWLRRAAGGRRRRLRRATTALKPGDLVELHYDPELLAREPPPAGLLEDRGDYTVWFKPAGLLSQGTDFGDHCSLLRQAERRRKTAFLVHRLDREAAGLMVVAHAPRAAAALSEQFRSGQVEKRYRVQVRGRLAGEGRIELPLDGKPARSDYRGLAYDARRDVSTLEVTLRGGRQHQVRRHLEAAGHPVIGDPRYGRGNKAPGGMKLVATELRFTCPQSGRQERFQAPEDAPPV